MKELNLTQGSVPRVLLQLAVSFLIASVLQVLYGGTDLSVVEQYDDSVSVTAVAIGSWMTQTVTRIILDTTTGTTVLIAIAAGAEGGKKVAFTIGSSVWLFSITGVLLTLVMVIFHGRITESMHMPTEAIADAKSYILVCSAGILSIVGYNIICGILRGLRDSETPLYFVTLACVINIVLDFILVGYFHLGATEVAIATITTQGIGFIISLWFLYQCGFHFGFTRKDIRLNRNLAREIMTLRAPIALQDTLINISFPIITVIVSQMGVIASASLGVVEKTIVLAILPPMTISSAVATMTAQNYEARPIQRMNRCLASGIGIAFAFGVSICVYSQFLPETLAVFFIKDAVVVSMTAEYLWGYSIDCIVVSFVSCINSYFSGQGNSLFPMIRSLVATFLFRVLLSYWFSQMDNSSLFIAGFTPPLSTVVSLLICVWYLRYTRKKTYLKGTMMPAMSN